MVSLRLHLNGIVQVGCVQVKLINVCGNIGVEEVMGVIPAEINDVTEISIGTWPEATSGTGNIN